MVCFHYGEKRTDSESSDDETVQSEKNMKQTDSVSKMTAVVSYFLTARSCIKWQKQRRTTDVTSSQSQK